MSQDEQDTVKQTPSTTKQTEHKEKIVVSTPKKSRTLIISLSIVFGTIILLGLGIGGGMLIQQNLPTGVSYVSSSGPDGNKVITKEESDIASVAEKVNPSVVSIISTTTVRGYYTTNTGEAAGTGIIVSKDGYVMTNNHVIDGSSNVTVVDSAGNRYKNVTIIGRDPLNDVAFLKIKSDKEFDPAELGDSSTVRIGQQVVAIGNALGQYSNTVTSGIISGTGRPVTAQSELGGDAESLTDLIQTDASINPGNSGGPLVNMAGQVIGINTAIVEDANGIGFAIPINSTKGVLAGVLKNGKVQRAFLGVSYLTITPDIADEYNLPIKHGAYIYSKEQNAVSLGSPADKAGLLPKDIITKVNDTELGKGGSLSSIIGMYKPGDKIKLTVLRDGKSKFIDVILSNYTP